MFAFLQFLFLVFVFAFVLILVIGFVAYRKLHGMAQHLRDQMGGFSSSQGDSHSQHASSHRQQNREYSADDEVIVDERSPEEANRKIFPKDEGEYVDFKEVK